MKTTLQSTWSIIHLIHFEKHRETPMYLTCLSSQSLCHDSEAASGISYLEESAACALSALSSLIKLNKEHNHAADAFLHSLFCSFSLYHFKSKKQCPSFKLFYSFLINVRLVKFILDLFSFVKTRVKYFLWFIDTNF